MVWSFDSAAVFIYSYTKFPFCCSAYLRMYTLSIIFITSLLYFYICIFWDTILSWVLFLFFVSPFVYQFRNTLFVHVGVCYLLLPMLKTYLSVIGPVFGCMSVVRATDIIRVTETLDNMSELCPPMYYAFHTHANVVYMSSGTYTFLIARPLSLASLGDRQDLDGVFGPQWYMANIDITSRLIFPHNPCVVMK